MAEGSRRGFIKAASATVGAVALAGRLPAWGGGPGIDWRRGDLCGYGAAFATSGTRRARG